MALVLFTPLSSVFGLVTLPLNAYLIMVVLFLIPVAVMELAKALGLIKKKNPKKA